MKRLYVLLASAVIATTLIAVATGASALPTTFTRVDDSDALAGKATRITLQGRGVYSLSAVRTDAGNLKLIGWSTGGATVSRQDDSANQAGAVSEIAMTRSRNIPVTAVRTANGTLKLISWDDNIDLSSINRLKDSANQAGEATRIAIQPVGLGREAELVTACRTGSGILKLISWNLQRGDGALTRLGDSQNKAGAISLVDMTTVMRGNIIVTAVRNASGDLKLISWRISPDGTTFDRLDDSGTQAGKVSEIAIAGSEEGTRAVTAVRDGAGNLKLISWDIAQDGTITRLDDSANEAGQATNIAIDGGGGDFSPSRYVTAVRTGSGNLRLIAWDVDPSTGDVARTGDSANQAGAVSEVALAQGAGAPRGSNRLVTAVRDGGGNLKIITWNMQD
jgi:hypothetical protein